MSETDDSDSDRDEYDISARLNLRDYPGTVLVLMSVLGSSLAWLLYKRLDRKSSPAVTAPDPGQPVDLPRSSDDAPGAMP